MTQSTTMDGSTLAVLTARFEGIARKMANTLHRTGRSGILTIARDFSCVVLTARHELLATAESLPNHVLRGPDIMTRTMTDNHPVLRRGDAFLHNSPYHGCTHPADHSILVPIIDDAHLMQTDCLRKLRLLCEDFPRSHNLVLIGQPPLLQSLALSINEEIRSRVTYSVVLPRLAPEAVEAYILAELDRCGLGHNVFTADALALIVRSGEGLLRRTKNLCLGTLIEAVRDQTRIADLKQVNRVLVQPHWRKDCDAPLA